MLFNDPFLGICDSTLSGKENAYYAHTANALAAYADHPEYGKCFRMLGQLARVLSRKAELGARTRALYQAGDKQGMQLLDDALADLVRKGVATLDDALVVANDPAAMRTLFGR